MGQTDSREGIATAEKAATNRSKLVLRKKSRASDQDSFARPFLKWAGGKGQLLEQFDSFFPEDLRLGKIDRYIEPFVGSGAVFFHVMNNYGSSIKSAVLCDINEELVIVYKVIQRDIDDLVSELERMDKSFQRLDDAGRRKKFEGVREEFNQRTALAGTLKYSRDWVHRAAQFIFLNKTCYNGLFRVNKNGEFNTPFGKYANPRILDEWNLRSASRMLAIADCRNADFALVKGDITHNTFVYFDPPYRPLSETAYFTSYSKNTFGDPEQVRLATFYRSLSDKKRCKLMLSNSDPQNTNQNDHFFTRLYSGFRIERVSANRMINCQAGKRGKIQELLILNY